MHVAAAAIKELFNNPTDAFWTGKVMTFLFDGIEIDCNTTNSLAKLTCKEIRKSNNPAIQPINSKKMKFSLFGGVN